MTVVFDHLFKNRRRRKLLAQPLPNDWQAIVERNVAVYALLPGHEQRRLIEAARIIAAERPFEGCRGLEMTDEVRATIAAQAALMVLGEEGYYFDRVPSILVYPSAYIREHSLGWQGPVDPDAELLGESWHRGSIILSWPAVLSGGRNPRDGQNLVLHEFAHHLDGLDGEMGGTPPLPSSAAHRQWREVFDHEYTALCDQVALGRPTVLDPYGTTSQAELFAVATECFFERPGELRERHAELYACLRDFYKVDPVQWFASPVADRSQATPRAPHSGVGTEVGAVELPPLATADQYFTRACDYFDDGRFDLAAADFNRCLRLSPDDQEALVWRSRAHFMNGHVEAALADAERACRLDKGDLEAVCQRGICRGALSQFEEALRDFDRARAEVESHIEALFYRGVARAELGELRTATSDFTRVIELDPQDAEAYLERAQCLEEMGDAAAAERDRARANELKPSSPI